MSRNGPQTQTASGTDSKINSGTIVATLSGAPAPVEAIRIDAPAGSRNRRLIGMTGQPFDVPEGTYWIQAILPDPTKGSRTTNAEEVVVTAGAKSQVALQDENVSRPRDDADGAIQRDPFDEPRHASTVTTASQGPLPADVDFDALIGDISGPLPNVATPVAAPTQSTPLSTPPGVRSRDPFSEFDDLLAPPVSAKKTIQQPDEARAPQPSISPASTPMTASRTKVPVAIAASVVVVLAVFGAVAFFNQLPLQTSEGKLPSEMPMAAPPALPPRLQAGPTVEELIDSLAARRMSGTRGYHPVAKQPELPPGPNPGLQTADVTPAVRDPSAPPTPMPKPALGPEVSNVEPASTPTVDRSTAPQAVGWLALLTKGWLALLIAPLTALFVGLWQTGGRKVVMRLESGPSGSSEFGIDALQEAQMQNALVSPSKMLQPAKPVHSEAVAVVDRALGNTLTANEATRFVTAHDAGREWLCIVPAEANEFTSIRIEDWGDTAQRAPTAILRYSNPGLDRLWQFANAHILETARDMAAAMLRAGPILSPVEAAVASYVLLRTEWSDDLLRLADAMLEQEPNLPDMHAVRAEVLARLGRHEQAGKALLRLGHGIEPWPLLRPGITYVWQRAQLYLEADDDAPVPAAALRRLIVGLRPLATLMDSRQLALIMRAPEGASTLAKSLFPNAVVSMVAGGVVEGAATSPSS